MTTNTRDKTVYLEISSWQGISIGAEHFYGKLIGHIDGEYTAIELMHPLSKKMADELNAKDDWDGYEEGMETERFETGAEVRQFAIETWQKHFPKAVMLFEGNPAYCEPKRCLACPTEEAMNVFNEAHKLYSAMEDRGVDIDDPDMVQMNNVFEKMKEVIEEETE